jgi:hypothetical protein
MARQVNQTHENYSVFDQGVGGGHQVLSRLRSILGRVQQAINISLT